ncbi:hypothetical protein [Pedobacter kyungheensis]|nr:hypothetical protein [Pedobacter kyungheensis]
MGSLIMQPALFFCFWALAASAIKKSLKLFDIDSMSSPLYLSGKPALKSAQQVLEVFCESYSLEKVKLVLLEVFQGYALNDKKGFLELGISEQEVGEVFDGLIELVGAVRTLVEQGETDGLGSEV